MDECSPYRAPETIFGAKDYDPFSVDLWSFGGVCAEFFTSLKYVPDEYLSEDEYDEGVEEEFVGPLKPFVVPETLDSRRGYWSKTTLFDSERGAIGLAWSIFKTRGTPDDINWPVNDPCTAERSRGG